MIDTGAKSTHVARWVAMALALPLIGQRSLRSSTGSSTIDVFVGDVMIPGLGSFSNRQIPELPATTLTYQGVLGRDILDQCVLIVDGPLASFTLRF